MKKKLLAIILTLSIVFSVIYIPSAFAENGNFTEETTAQEEIPEKINEEEINAEKNISDNLTSEKLPEEVTGGIPVFISAAPFMPPVTGTALRRARMLKGAPKEDNGLKINKTAHDNSDGTYTIRLEAYATGEKVITEEKQAVPTDIVLVLDQSHSMSEMDMDSIDHYELYTGNERTNEALFEQRFNGGKNNLYYMVSDGVYASVGVKKENVTLLEPEKKYFEYGKYPANSFEATNINLHKQANGNIYACVNGKYEKVIQEKNGKKYKYKLENGTIIWQKKDFNQNQMKPVFEYPTDGKIYKEIIYNTADQYTYYYNNGIKDIIIGKSNHAEKIFTQNYLYKCIVAGNKISRLDALKSALNSFADTVQRKSDGADGIHGTADDMDHRLAVVGFASEVSNELFIGADQYSYESLKGSEKGRLNEAFQDMSKDKGRDKVSASFSQLKIASQTNTHIGLKIAEMVLDANPVVSGQKRNRVVIVFTDGGITNNNGVGTGGFDKSLADEAIMTSKRIKDKQTTVYSIGMRPEANAGADFSEPGNVGSESGDSWESACNWFLHNISSNNGVKNDHSYYLSAKNSSDLNSVFKQIANNIESGGSSTTLNAKSVIKDIIAPEFITPENASEITIETYECTGKDTWKKNSGAMGAEAKINGDTVSVTGFDFSGNYVGPIIKNGTVTGYRGHKLVVSFKVKSKPGFLGGNDICTNAGAGIYENETSDKPVGEFPKPQVNVPVPDIKDITVSANDIYTYLKGNVTADDIKNYVSVKYGDTVLDLTKSDFGIEPWQYKYLDIKVAAPADFTDLKEDTSYTFTVSVSPKTDGTKGEISGSSKYTEKTGTVTKAIKVMKPEITWRDSEIELGSVPSYTDNCVGTEWKYAGTPSTSLSPIVGTAPHIDFTYTPAATALYKDTRVNAASKINGEDITSYVSYVHVNCTFEGCAWDKSCEFIVHIKVFDLTVKKQADKLYSPDDSFIFNITGPDGKTIKTVIKGTGSITIKDLPIGDYTVTEEGKWSWRYSCAEPSKTVSPLDIENGSAELIFNNSLINEKWLSFETLCENLWQSDGTIISSIKKGIKGIIDKIF